MSEHGWSSVAESASAVSGKSKCDFDTVFPQYTGDQLIGSGFRNFLGKPGPKETFRFKDLPVDRKNQRELRTAIGKLSSLIEHHSLGESDGDNPGIPSGYSYLMQLIAHDLVASASSLGRIDSGRMALNNNRSAMLRLESIYGGGPEGSPLLYEPSPTGDPETPSAPHTRLRLGPLNTGQEFSCPFRDLARVNLTKSVADLDAEVNIPSSPSDALKGSPDVIVGDRRNDDHAIISQLTVVFHLLHNGLVDKTKDMRTHSRYTEAAFNRYFYARMAATLIFRNVIRHDVLKRFLHPDVYSLYNVDNPPFLDAFDDDIPLELTHGALRVCHTMLRVDYTFNERIGFSLSDSLLQNSENSARLMPLPEIWAVAWSNFFPIEGHAPPRNMSVLMGPHYNAAVKGNNFPPIDDVPVNGGPKPGLAYRDMLSAALANLWSVPALIDRLGKSQSPLAQLFNDWPLAKRADREAALRTWLISQWPDNPNVQLTDAELDTLAKDPPLPFFLMFEAQEDGKGARFGLLGSVIVAEAIFGILNKDPVVPRHPLVPLDKALEALGREVFGEPWLPAYPRLDTMSDVIAFVADMHGLQDTRPKFI